MLDANAGKTGATPTLYLMCAASSMRIGEAATFVTSFNAATGATLVVRQQALSTDVDLLTADASGAIHLDELAGDIVDKLARAGLGRHRRLSVDAAAFATDGSVLVGAGDDGTQTLPTRLDLTPYVQATLATSATAIAPAPGPGQ